MRWDIPIAAFVFAAVLGWTAHAFLLHGALEQCAAMLSNENDILRSAMDEIEKRDIALDLMSRSCPVVRGERL